MKRPHEQFRSDSIRLTGWDYSQAGWYFVTVCTRNQRACFGEIVEGKMRLSLEGQVAAEEWMKTSALRESVELDAWTIMPNHVHGIIVIQEPLTRYDIGDLEGMTRQRPGGKTRQRRVSTEEGIDHPEETCTTAGGSGRRNDALNGLKSGGLGSIVNQFKGACTKRIRREINPNFAWQARYYEHIIRNDRSLDRIRRYIDGNPGSWEADRLYGMQIPND